MGRGGGRCIIVFKLLRESEIIPYYESWERFGTCLDLVSAALYRNLINMNSVLYTVMKIIHQLMKLKHMKQETNTSISSL